MSLYVLCMQLIALIAIADSFTLSKMSHNCYDHHDETQINIFVDSQNQSCYRKGNLK